jgi:hypothetical protein
MTVICAWFVLARKFFFCPNYALGKPDRKMVNNQRYVGDSHKISGGRRLPYGDKSNVALYPGKEAIYDCANVVDGLYNRVSIKSFNLFEGYEKGDIQIVARFSAIDCPADYQLVFRAIPIGSKDWSPAGEFEKCYLYRIDGGSQGDQASMLVGVGEDVENRQAVVPSYVWLEKAHDVEDARMNHFWGSPNHVLKVRLRFPETETDPIEGGVRIEPADAGAHRLVEGGSKVVEGIGGNWPKRRREGRLQFCLSEVVAGIRVSIGKVDTRIFVKESLCSRIKFFPVFPSTIEHEIRAIKGVYSHESHR